MTLHKAQYPQLWILTDSSEEAYVVVRGTSQNSDYLAGKITGVGSDVYIGRGGAVFTEKGDTVGQAQPFFSINAPEQLNALFRAVIKQLRLGHLEIHSASFAIADGLSSEAVLGHVESAKRHLSAAYEQMNGNPDVALAARSPVPEGGDTKLRAAIIYQASEALQCNDPKIWRGVLETIRRLADAATPQPNPRDELLPRIKECIEQLRDRLTEIDRWQNDERNSLPGFSQSVIFADRVLIDIQEALGDE